VIKTADYGVFGLSVPVDGSDGISHNVTGIQSAQLGPEPIAVTMAPYALKAASVDVLASPDYIVLEGDDIAIGNVAAQSIAAGQSFDASSAKSFTAGSLKGFKEISLEQVNVSGGSLKWLGGTGPASGVTFANLGDMSVGGGELAFSGSLACGSNGSQTWKWTAAGDGFLQLQAKTPDSLADAMQAGVDVLDEKGNNAFTVTPLGALGPSGGSSRRLLWTVPVLKGQTVQLTLKAGSSAFTLTSARAQFISFGVKE